MDTDRLVCIIAAIFGLDYRICAPARDLEAEDALTRALARNGGDGLTACNPDAGACPKPCLRHRRANVGIWPNWRMKRYRRWDFESENCRPCLPDLAPRLDCGTYQEHLAHEELKRKTAAYIQNRRNQEWDYDPHATPPIFWSNGPSGEDGGLVSLFNLQAEDLLRQARNISDNMGISPLWDREPDLKFGGETVIHELAANSTPANEIDTTWHAQYPAPTLRSVVNSQWTITENEPLPFEGRTYRFDPISFTVPPPAESPPPSASPQPPSPDSEA